MEEVPAAYAKKLKAQAAEHEGRAAQTEEELKQCASAREDLKLLSDYYRLRAQKYEALGEILQSEKTCMITGFIPKRDAKGLEEKLIAGLNLQWKVRMCREDGGSTGASLQRNLRGVGGGRDRILWLTGEGGDGPDRHHGSVLCIFVWSDAFRCGIRIYCIFDVLPGT